MSQKRTKVKLQRKAPLGPVSHPDVPPDGLILTAMESTGSRQPEVFTMAW